KRLPFFPRRLSGARRHRFDHDDLGSMAMPVSAQQDIRFGALDIDLEEIDRGDVVIVAELRKGDHWQANGSILCAERPRSTREGFDRRRQTVEPVEYVKIRGPASASDEAADADVARAQSRIELDQVRLRLDDDALPSPFVEPG